MTFSPIPIPPQYQKKKKKKHFNHINIDLRLVLKDYHPHYDHHLQHKKKV